jgi:hypothetical protein
VVLVLVAPSRKTTAGGKSGTTGQGLSLSATAAPEQGGGRFLLRGVF